MPENGVVVIDAGTFSFDAARPLRGNAIVLIKGNVIMVPGNGSDFRGMLYVDGNLTVRDPSMIRGAVLCTGDMTVQGSTEYATIQYDADVLSGLMTHIGNYTASNTTLL